MPVPLRVSDVRRELYLAAGGTRSAGTGQPSTALLGRLFHDVFAQLVDPHSEHNLSSVLIEADRDVAAWRTELVHHAYHRLAGPRLTEHHAALQGSGSEVLDFWRAVAELCGWLAELFGEIRQAHFQGRVLSRADITGVLEQWVSPEEALEWVVHQPGWRDSVRLTGVADAVIRIPLRAVWCLVELKLGRSAPEADLAQACLYHQMLQSLEVQTVAANEARSNGNGSLALVSFAPQRAERLINGDDLNGVKPRLIELIGRLAGVSDQVPTGDPVEPQCRKRVVPSANPAQLEQARQLVAAFSEYGAELELEDEPIVGPTFVRYNVTLGRGVRLPTVKSNAVNVQLRMELAQPPLVSNHDGRVVIDIQREDRQYVRFSEIRDAIPAADPAWGSSRVLVGVDLNGELEFADLSATEHAHLLVAGSTASGKSEWLRSAVASLLVRNTPETLRLLIIDPKRNAFHDLRESPFLYRPIVYPGDEDASEVLQELVDEMNRRYATLDGADTIAESARRSGTVIPRIVCICDEYFDLINRSTAERRQLEQHIFRLGAKARAAGIHLMLATQQPSREVVRGALDANIPARVALKMTRGLESRMLIGQTGAEHLLGRGDLLFKDIGEPRRLQSAYLTADERRAIFQNSVENCVT